jgi:hypothetical protein
MTARRGLPQRLERAYDRPVTVGLGVVGAAWVVTATFLLLILLA